MTTDFDERRKQAFVFASDTVKQLLTLSTAIVTLTVTFQEKVVKSDDDFTKGLLLASWMLFLVSIIAGIVGMMGLTGELSGSSEPAWVGNPRVRLFPMIQSIFFVGGTICIVWFGWRAL